MMEFSNSKGLLVAELNEIYGDMRAATRRMGGDVICKNNLNSNWLSRASSANV